MISWESNENPEKLLLYQFALKLYLFYQSRFLNTVQKTMMIRFNYFSSNEQNLEIQIRFQLRLYLNLETI